MMSSGKNNTCIHSLRWHYPDQVNWVFHTLRWDSQPGCTEHPSCIMVVGYNSSKADKPPRGHGRPLRSRRDREQIASMTIDAYIVSYRGLFLQGRCTGCWFGRDGERRFCIL